MIQRNRPPGSCCWTVVLAGVLLLGLWPQPIRAAAPVGFNADILRGRCVRDEDVAPETLVRVPTDDRGTIRIRLKGTDYRIPKHKLLYPAVECRTGDNIAVLIDPSKGTGAPGSSEPPAQDFLERTTLLGSAQIISLDRLRSTFLARRDPTYALQVEIDLPGAVIGPINPDGRYGADLYYDIPASGDGVVILCRRELPQDGTASFCSLWLNYRDVSWQLNFSRRHLARWREIAAAVTALLDRFTAADARP